MLYTVISVLHVCISVFLVLLVLLQQGKGADAGATFGGGSNTLFGAGGADTFLTKATTIVAFLFMSTSFALAISAMPSGDGPGTTKLFGNAQTEKVGKSNDQTGAVSSEKSSTTSVESSSEASTNPPSSLESSTDNTDGSK